MSTGRIVALIAAVALVAFALLRRRRLGGERFVIVLVVAAILAVYGSGVLAHVDIQKGIEDLAKALGKWTYALVGVMAFAETGAVQCGFCTPGFVVATVDLLARSHAPGDDEIREALSGNLCRCTGYQKIFDAVRLAGARWSAS